MNLDKKQLPQLIALGVLHGRVHRLPVVPGDVFEPFLGARGVQVETAAAAPGKAGPAQPEEASADAPEAVSSSDSGLAEVRRDPFAPQKLPARKRRMHGKSPSPTATRASTMVKNPMGKVPPINLSPMNPFSQVSGVPAAASQPTVGLRLEQAPMYRDHRGYPRRAECCHYQVGR